MNEGQGTISAHPDVAGNIGLLEAWLQSKMAYQDLPGTAVGIVHDQELVYARGFGWADVDSGQAVEPDSIFRIASHSKLFTAISIMQLRDREKLQLDDPVSRYLPWFNVQNSYTNAPEITIRHLLTHTSGLPREAGSSYWLNFDFPDIGQVKERLGRQETIFPSATRWKYSNLALTIAGEVVETVSGLPFADYVKKNILDPLEMTSTSVVFPVSHAKKLVTGYGRRLPDGARERLPFVDAAGMAAATGVSSSVADMAKFVSWQFRLLESNETEVLKANTLREMQRVNWIQPDWKSGWGIGFGITHTEDRDLIGHGGGYPGYLTNTRISPQEKVGVVVFTNSLDGEPEMISNRIFEWVAPAITRAVNGDPGVEPDPEWSRLAGTYRNLWGDTHILPLDGKLRMITPTLSDPKADALTLEPVDGNTFRLEGTGGGPLGEPVVFEIGPEGRATRVTIGDGFSTRVSYDE